MNEDEKFLDGLSVDCSRSGFVEMVETDYERLLILAWDGFHAKTLEKTYPRKDAISKARKETLLSAVELISEPCESYDESTWRFLMAEKLRTILEKQP